MNGMRKIRLITRIALFVLMLLPMTAFAEDEGFTWEPQNPRVGERVTFTGPDTDSFHSQSVTRWTWTWPDNTKKEGINTKVSDYTFTTAGKNTVTLNVQYDDGRGDTFSHDIIVSKYQPKVDITSGNGIADFTAKVGDVGDRYVNFILPPDMPKSIEVTYSIGQVRVTDNISFGQYKQTLDSADLNSLPAGNYPIKLSSPGMIKSRGSILHWGQRISRSIS